MIFLPGNPANKYHSANTVIIPNHEINTNGYRAPEFDSVDWANSVVIFGCSHVFGTGSTLQDTIPAQLEALIKRPVINMGVPASSMQFSLRNQQILAAKHVPYAVVNLWSSFERNTVFAGDSDTLHVDGFPYHLGPWIENPIPGRYALYYRELRQLYSKWIADESHMIQTALDIQKQSVKLWQSTRHVQLTLLASTAECLGIELLPIMDRASDNAHAGAKSNRFAAEKIAKILLDNHQ